MKYVTTASAPSWLLDALGGLVDTVGGPLTGLLVAVGVLVAGLVCAVVVGVMTNDVYEALPRVTRWLLRWAARRRHGELAAARAEEQAAGIATEEVRLYGLVMALRFVVMAVAWRCWSRLREPAPRKPIELTSAVLTPVPAGQHGDVELPPADVAGPEGGNPPRDAGRLTPVVVGGVRLAGKALMVSGLVLGVLCVIAGFAAFASTADADLDLVYAGGDEPETRTEPSGCFRSPCSQPSSDVWQLGSGSSIETIYTSGRAEVSTLFGDLRLEDSSCAPARVAWRITADGTALADGTLAEGDAEDLEAVAVPSGRAAESLTVEARRLDDHSCPADLLWTGPGYETPGILPPLW